MTDLQSEPPYEDASPNPEFLIKSIAEQGYRLESALADLMDNSVSANADKIEVLIDTELEPFTLFLADNGNGMDEQALIMNMKFPSNSPDEKRKGADLGRFGLGLKTSSFSQTRRFTVLARKKGSEIYCGRTWDVKYLKDKGKWRIIINSEDEIKKFLDTYNNLSNNHLHHFPSFEANVIVIWQGLYKFEDYLDKENRINALQREITDVTSSHLSIVFHRFMERKSNPLSIRINNNILRPFNPFPTNISDFRAIDYKTKNFKDEIIKLEGFVLPARSMEESKNGLSKWVPREKGLMDMEGLYIYRADRLIRFGGWHGIIKKMPRLQLARLRVEIGNGADHLIHLNVAKSQINIPHDLRQAFLRYVSALKSEAEKEFFNRLNSTFSGVKKDEKTKLFIKKATNRGSMLEVNSEFIPLKELRSGLDKNQCTKLDILFRMINITINRIKEVHEDQIFSIVEDEYQISTVELISYIKDLISKDISKEQIREAIIPNLGYISESLPIEILNLLSNE
jgi:hypothetical protein